MLENDGIAIRFARVRARTEALAASVSPEDAMVQSMPDASPLKWHLAHTTWFFEEFVLARFDPAHRWNDERWRLLFNSYYELVGPRHDRAARGLLSRPSLEEVRAWRASVDEQMVSLLARADASADQGVSAATLVGTHHEQQHQELMLTDIKHAFWSNPLHPSFAGGGGPTIADSPSAALSWVSFDERVVDIGHSGESFAFDNETPNHRAFVEAFSLASRLVTNEEFVEFIRDEGYERPALWLSDGWAAAQAGGWRAPLYWQRGPSQKDEQCAFGLRGSHAIDPHAPVSHVSFYEADAYARWSGARLPTEHEWESVARDHPIGGNFVESGLLSPAPARKGLTQIFGDAWEWTASAYLPYPRFRPPEGALGEYNGKFMSGQMVLRGGSCLSPRDHLRATYRNFFPPAARWQVTGIRLARNS